MALQGDLVDLPVSKQLQRLAQALSVLVAVGGCTGPYRGAALMDPSAVPAGRLVAAYVRASCTDGSDAYQRVYLDYVLGADGAPFLVERRLAAEWLVISNSHRDGGDIVFQAVRERDGKALLEYRFPIDGKQAGAYAKSLRYTRPKGTTHRFRAQRASAQLTCRLVRVEPRTGVPLGEEAAAMPLPAPGEGAAEEEVDGWGYDGRSFRAGDRILVQVQGRAVVAQVVRATGRAYLVRYEGVPEGAGVWVEPARIVGRFE